MEWNGGMDWTGLEWWNGMEWNEYLIGPSPPAARPLSWPAFVRATLKAS